MGAWAPIMHIGCVVLAFCLHQCSAVSVQKPGRLERSNVKSFLSSVPQISRNASSEVAAVASSNATVALKIEDFKHAPPGQSWLELGGRDVDLKFVNLTAHAWGADVVARVWANEPLNRHPPRVWQAPSSKTSAPGHEEDGRDVEKCVKRSAEWQEHHALRYDLKSAMHDDTFSQVSVMVVPAVFATFEGLIFNSTHYAVGVVAAPPNAGNNDVGDLSVDAPLYQAPFETLKNMGQSPHFGGRWDMNVHLCDLFFSRQLRKQLDEEHFGWYDEMISFFGDHRSEEASALANCTKGPVHVYPKAGTTLGLYAGNFFHWIASSLPRAVALHTALGEEALSLPMLTYGHRFATQGLELLGFTPAVLKADSMAFAHQLYVVQGLSQDWMESSQTVQAVRNAVLGAVGSGGSKVAGHDESPPQVLLISRADHGRKASSFREVSLKLDEFRSRITKQREILNEVALLHAMVEALPSGNVSQVRLAEHSFKDQVRLFHSAAAVVGVDGAGLANLIFARPGAVVVDLLPTHDRFGLLPNECGATYFWHLSEALRPGGVALQYWSLALPNANWYSAIEVPVHSLAELLRHTMPNLTRTSSLTR